MDREERLEAFEKMLADTEKNYGDAQRRMDELRAAARRRAPPTGSTWATSSCTSSCLTCMRYTA